MDEEKAGEVPVSEDLTKRLVVKARVGEVPRHKGSGGRIREDPKVGGTAKVAMQKEDFVHLGRSPAKDA
ncbi:hypothetical protein DSO57_1026222 [Entomophthora muscae]|uniref:Uncharacterized protein n=1 Tax=Entomophthora muscae TaxID=34485 RepID=A0ACC2U073_9FUNG|nr:hypothetical protein DSO57_1026222 [Entomophthora muscae]